VRLWTVSSWTEVGISDGRERGNEPWGFIEAGVYSDQLSNY